MQKEISHTHTHTQTEQSSTQAQSHRQTDRPCGAGSEVRVLWDSLATVVQVTAVTGVTLHSQVTVRTRGRLAGDLRAEQ